MFLLYKREAQLIDVSHFSLYGLTNNFFPLPISVLLTIFDFVTFDLQLATSVQCDLLTYRNLNMTPFLEEAGIETTLEAHWGQDINFLLDLGSVEFRLGQGSIHTLNMALQTWNQVGMVFSEIYNDYYVYEVDLGLEKQSTKTFKIKLEYAYITKYQSTVWSLKCCV